MNSDAARFNDITVRALAARRVRRTLEIMSRFRSVSLVLLLAAGWPKSDFAAERLTLNFNPDWRFIKADVAGAETRAFDDTAWSVISTPHTFNDVDTFDNWSTPG